MFVAAGFSIPYTLVARQVELEKQRRFRAKMQALGRTMEWTNVVSAVDEGRGTLIVEHYSFKGPVRWWWTPDDIYEVCPYPTVDWLTMFTDESFRPFAEWCCRRYTSPDEGKALLAGMVGIPKRDVRSLWSRVEASGSEGMRWIEVPPPRHK